MDELLVGMAVEEQFAAVSVQGDFEHAIGLAAEPGVRERLAIGVEFGHWGLLIDGNEFLSTALLPTFPRSTTAQRLRPLSRMRQRTTIGIPFTTQKLFHRDRQVTHST